MGKGVESISSFSVCDAASVVEVLTLNITSVRCIICSPSITFGQSFASGDGGDSAREGEEPFGEQDGEDNGEVRKGLLLAEVEAEEGKDSLESNDGSFTGELGEREGLITGGDVLVEELVEVELSLLDILHEETSVSTGEIPTAVVTGGL